MADPRRANRGVGPEEMVLNACEYYKRHGAALLDKVPTPTHAKKGGGLFYARRSIVDFIGTLPGGISVALEVKSSNLRTRFDLNHLMAEQHQIEYLRDQHRLGGISAYMLVWKLDGLPRCNLVSWSTAREWIKDRRPSLDLDTLKALPFLCAFRLEMQGFHFLPALLEVMAPDQRLAYQHWFDRDELPLVRIG